MSDLHLRILNPVMRTLIRRGIGSMAREMMVIHWIGKKSGRPLSTPVSRFDAEGDFVFTTTPSGFRHNFASGWPAQLQLGRRLVPVTGQMVSDPEEVALRMLTVLDTHGLKRGQRNLGINMTDRPDQQELTEFVAETGWSILDFTPTEEAPPA